MVLKCIFKNLMHLQTYLFYREKKILLFFNENTISSIFVLIWISKRPFALSHPCVHIQNNLRGRQLSQCSNYPRFGSSNGINVLKLVAGVFLRKRGIAQLVNQVSLKYVPTAKFSTDMSFNYRI
jgi:hypothetical protein